MTVWFAEPQPAPSLGVPRAQMLITRAWLFSCAQPPADDNCAQATKPGMFLPFLDFDPHAVAAVGPGTTQSSIFMLLSCPSPSVTRPPPASQGGGVPKRPLGQRDAIPPRGPASSGASALFWCPVLCNAAASHHFFPGGINQDKSGGPSGRCAVGFLVDKTVACWVGPCMVIHPYIRITGRVGCILLDSLH